VIVRGERHLLAVSASGSQILAYGGGAARRIWVVGAQKDADGNVLGHDTGVLIVHRHVAAVLRQRRCGTLLIDAE
jgi:hypothetical protein